MDRQQFGQPFLRESNINERYVIQELRNGALLDEEVAFPSFRVSLREKTFVTIRSLAYKKERAGNACPLTSLNLLAVQPWSIFSHSLFPLSRRKRASDLVLVCASLARTFAMNEERAMMDCLINYVIPNVIRERDHVSLALTLQVGRKKRRRNCEWKEDEKEILKEAVEVFLNVNIEEGMVWKIISNSFLFNHCDTDCRKKWKEMALSRG